MTPETSNTIAIVTGAVLTLMILSYLIGDSFLFRLAVHILVGAGAAYAAVAVIDVLNVRLAQPLIQRNNSGDILVAVVGLILSLLLLFKASPRSAWLGNISVGYLIGVGAAVALGGALFGTLGPQVMATASPAGGLFGPTNSDGFIFLLNIIILVGTIVTLLSFGYYRTARGSLLGGATTVGRRFFLMIAFGATFALVFIASATLLMGRLEALIQGFWTLRALFPGQ